jgi:phage replication-related protein YjqB (UPF0714/DUF867 family)
MDKYRSFAELSAAENAGAYRIVALQRGSLVAVVAPHAGGIEPGTSEIARAIAGTELSLYLFEGRKVQGNSDLHITSTNFDEPQGLQLASGAQVVLAVHGEVSETRPVVYLGGRDQALGQTLGRHLEAGGFQVEAHNNPELQGVHPENICNRGQSAAGVQLEVSRALRLELFPSLLAKGRAAPRQRFHEFVRAVRQGLSLPLDA